jgi:predicted alpha/beta hydrolase family esterase
MTPPTVLVLPGLGGSGAEHWQTIWERLYGYERVSQQDWNRPELEAWRGALELAVDRARGAVLLVAHSLACTLVAHFAARPAANRVRGALMVAPADVDSPAHAPPETRSFSPIPLISLPFPAIVVASRDDPYAAFERTKYLATRWGAELVDAGHCGHINADSQLGTWAAGHDLLLRLIGAGNPSPPA